MTFNVLNLNLKNQNTKCDTDAHLLMEVQDVGKKILWNRILYSREI